MVFFKISWPFWAASTSATLIRFACRDLQEALRGTSFSCVLQVAHAVCLIWLQHGVLPFLDTSPNADIELTSKQKSGQREVTHIWQLMHNAQARWASG